jgi:hypothetical protein
MMQSAVVELDNPFSKAMTPAVAHSCCALHLLTSTVPELSPSLLQNLNFPFNCLFGFKYFIDYCSEPVSRDFPTQGKSRGDSLPGI